MTSSLNTDELKQLQNIIEKASLSSDRLKENETQEAVSTALRYLERGMLRVASPKNTLANCGNVPMDGDLREWIVHSWVKEAILLAMKTRVALSYVCKLDGPKHSLKRLHDAHFGYHDKFDVQTNLGVNGVRSIPGSLIREGAFVDKGSIIMPSFINIGAWVGKNTMIDTWATAGSCAQIGESVHAAGGVGIGGVLEPAHATPVLIGDHAFLGSRAVVVEGAIVSSHAVLGANVCLTSSSPIYDVTTSEKTEYRGYVPPRAVVVPGTREKIFPGGTVQLQCAYIIAYRNENTDTKVSLNQVLRETGIVI